MGFLPLPWGFSRGGFSARCGCWGGLGMLGQTPESNGAQLPTDLHSWRDAIVWTAAPADKLLPSLLWLDNFDLNFDTASLSSPNIMGKEIIHIWKNHSALTEVKSNFTEARFATLSRIAEWAGRTVNFNLTLSLKIIKMCDVMSNALSEPVIPSLIWEILWHSYFLMVNIFYHFGKDPILNRLSSRKKTQPFGLVRVFCFGLVFFLPI